MWLNGLAQMDNKKFVFSSWVMFGRLFIPVVKGHRRLGCRGGLEASIRKGNRKCSGPTMESCRSLCKGH